MKLFLDDIREPSWVFSHLYNDYGSQSPKGWTVVRTANEAIDLLNTEEVTHISFDNDLGLIPDTLIVAREGWEVFRFMVDAIALGEIPYPEYINVHSANIVATQRMWDMLSDLDKFLINLYI